MNKIPKIIHYCWFGNKEIPENLQEYINSWKRLMPDYEIKRWDETNYDINKCSYIKEAYEAKKWAFVTDYVRLDVCYRYGGIYLDTDVEVIKSFDDLLYLDGFMGMEAGKNNKPSIGTGLALGMKKGLPIGKILRDEYHKMHFKKEDGTYDLTPCPKIQTKILKKYGFKLENKIQTIKGITIFPSEYFCPMSQYTGITNITNNTHSIHHYTASWLPKVEQDRRQLRIKYNKYGNLIAKILSTYIAYYKHYGFIKMWKEIIKKIKSNKQN